MEIVIEILEKELSDLERALEKSIRAFDKGSISLELQLELISHSDF